MADKKISALPAASTPLAGTEVLPIVQGGTTDQVSVANLTAGRAVSALSLATPDTDAATSITASGLSVGRGAAFVGGQTELFTVGARRLGIGTTGATSLHFYSGSAEAFRVDTNQNLVISTAGKGIDFSANTHAAGMTSELLTWYEEGVFTPGISFGGATTGITYAAGFTNGRYTRIGNRVFVQGSVILSNKGSATGTAAITGLPFTSLNAIDAYPAVALSLRNVTFANQFQGLVIANSTRIELYEITEAGAVTDITNADFANSSELQFSASYCV